MKRLKIPTSSLKGTPLTIAEMKEITGGLVGYYMACSCVIKYENGTSKQQEVMLYEGTVCSVQCASLCRHTSGCIAYEYHYSDGTKS